MKQVRIVTYKTMISEGVVRVELAISLPSGASEMDVTIPEANLIARAASRGASAWDEADIKAYIASEVDGLEDAVIF